MGRSLHKLTPIAIKNAKKTGLYGDGGGLYLQVSQCGTKAWLYRFMRHGVARKMGLGAGPYGPAQRGAPAGRRGTSCSTGWDRPDRNARRATSRRKIGSG